MSQDQAMQKAMLCPVCRQPMGSNQECGNCRLSNQVLASFHRQQQAKRARLAAKEAQK